MLNKLSPAVHAPLCRIAMPSLAHPTRLALAGGRGGRRHGGRSRCVLAGEPRASACASKGRTCALALPRGAAGARTRAAPRSRRRRIGISIPPARVRVAHDKGPVERFFLTVRHGFLQELPGYKGPDLHSRGVSQERDAVFFIDELEALLREWVAAVYHRRPHDGIGETGLWALRMSPAQMFEHGVTRAGYLEAPRDPHLAYHFLAVEWRTIQHYGFEIDGRYYRGPGLQGYVAGEKSPFHERGGRWPIHVDPDDIRQVYFFDLKNTKQWHPLAWTEAARSISRCVSMPSDVRAGPPNNRSNRSLVIVRPVQ